MSIKGGNTNMQKLYRGKGNQRRPICQPKPKTVGRQGGRFQDKKGFHCQKVYLGKNWNREWVDRKNQPSSSQQDMQIMTLRNTKSNLIKQCADMREKTKKMEEITKRLKIKLLGKNRFKRIRHINKNI